MQSYILGPIAQYARVLIAAIVVSTGWVVPAMAADVSRDIRAGRQDEGADFAGYLEIGSTAATGQVPVVGVENTEIRFTIGGHVRVKGFFADFLTESYNRGQLGYNLYSGNTWSFDLIATGSPDGVDLTLSNELDGLRDRSGAVESGLRVTGFTGPLIVQFEALSDITGSHDGGILSGSVARSYLWKNWNLHWLLGARYLSAETTNFLFGVEESEASERFPQFNAGAGVTYVTEIGATLPLNRYFIFRGTARYWSLPDSIADSPFIEDQNYSELSASLVFVY